jgi:hypothetical protein
MTALYGIAAMSALIAWCVRQPSDELFEDAHCWLDAADRWQECMRDPRAIGNHVDLVRRRNACRKHGIALARKALRRMPWKLI